mgnify:CR=1 FL=1
MREPVYARWFLEFLEYSVMGFKLFLEQPLILKLSGAGRARDKCDDCQHFSYNELYYHILS